MPFDGNAAKFVKPEVFSLPGLIAWLETQEAATTYSYYSNTDCVLCRYLRASGVRLRSLNSVNYRDDLGRHPLPLSLADVAHGDSLNEDPDARSYRGVLKRARQLLATA